MEMEYIHGLKKFRPLFLFAGKVLALFLFFLLLKSLHRILIEPSCDLPAAEALKGLNIYVLLSDTIIYPSQWILHALGYTTIMGERTLSIAGYRGVIIHAPCLGVTIMTVFAALIAAYPAKVSMLKRAGFIIAGILAIHFLNILRVTGIVLRNRYSLVLPIDHHDLFNIIIYAFVFFLFYFWTRYTAGSNLSTEKE